MNGANLDSNAPDRGSIDALLYVGIGLLVPIVPSILLYAVVATVIGEEVLEGADAIPGLATVVFWMPPVLGAIMLLVRWRVARWAQIPVIRVYPTLALVGALLLALGAYGVMSAAAGDANIGAGLLAVFGVALMALALVARSRAHRSRSTI